MAEQNNSDEKISFMPVCMSMGIAVGVAIGAACNNIPLWMCLGLAIGVGFGTAIDAGKKDKDE